MQHSSIFCKILFFLYWFASHSTKSYCDSDWASHPITWRSVARHFISLGSSHVSWKTMNQHVVSRSSAKAKYRSMAVTLCELKWLRQLLDDLCVSITQPVFLHCDNQAAICIAANLIFHERTKHIEIDCHFVWDTLQAGFITPSYIQSALQLTDILTKVLHRSHFSSLIPSYAFKIFMFQLEGEYCDIFGGNLIS